VCFKVVPPESLVKVKREHRKAFKYVHRVRQHQVGVDALERVLVPFGFHVVELPVNFMRRVEAVGKALEGLFSHHERGHEPEGRTDY
jgi:hypothetical protein